jgi:hypothetical protein
MDFTVSNLNDDAVVVLAITTLNNATTVREYLLQLADMRRTLERMRMLMEEMHEANHNVGDAINKDNRVSACSRRLDTALHRRDA